MSPAPVIPRGLLTDAFVAYLQDQTGLSALVGDGSVPNEAGWVGQPGVSVFTASVTVRTGPATPTHRDTLGQRHSSWTCGYSLRSVGALRRQCDEVGDRVRAAALGFTLPSGDLADGWALNDVVFTQLGAVNKMGNDENATFELDDTVQLWMGRRRA